MKRSNILFNTVILYMGLFSCTIHSKPAADSSSNTKVLASSENYVLKKLLNGPVSAVLYIEKTHTMLVQTRETLWKINDQGYIIDSISRPSGMYHSGIYFNEDYYVDWVFTGSKEKKKYSAKLNGNGMPEQALRALFDRADVVEFQKEHKDEKKGVAYVWSQSGASVIDITDRYDRIDTSCRPFMYIKSQFEEMGWNETCLEGYKKSGKRLLNFLGEQSIVSQKDENRPVHVSDFDKKDFHFEGGFGEWIFGQTLGRYLKYKGLPGGLPGTYWSGIAQVSIKHQSERLQFGTFATNDDESTEINNVSFYNLPDESPAHIKFMKIASRRDDYREIEKEFKKYYEKDIGLYVIRKKVKKTEGAAEHSEQHSGADEKYSQFSFKSSWQLRVSGIEPDDTVNGNIHFINGETMHYHLNGASVPEDMYSMPKSLSLNWIGNKKKKSAFKLYTGENKFSWHHIHDSNSAVSVEIVFDAGELKNAYKEIGDSKSYAELDIHLEPISKRSALLSVSLKNKKKKVELKNNIFKSAEPVYSKGDSNLASEFEKGKLWAEFELAYKNHNHLDDFLSTAKSISRSSPFAKDYASQFADHYTKLLIQYTISNDFDAAENIFYQYVENIIPCAGMDEKTSDIASNGLVLALKTNKKKINDTVFEKILGPKFNLNDQTNEILLYNLACYYSLNKDKETMLEAVKLSIKRGKDTDSFLQDTDFKYYWKDPDFLKAISSGK